MDTVMRCSEEGQIYFQSKGSYIEELEQKIAELGVILNKNYKEQCAFVEKARELDRAGDKYGALKVLNNVHFFTYTKDLECGIPETVDCWELNDYRKSLFLDLATDLFHKYGYDKYKLSIEQATWTYGNGVSTYIEGYFAGDGCIVKYGKEKYFLPIFGLDEIHNLKRFRVLTRMSYPEYGSYRICHTYKYKKQKSKFKENKDDR